MREFFYNNFVKGWKEAFEYNPLGMVALILCILGILFGTVTVGIILVLYTTWIAVLLYIPVAVFLLGVYVAVLNSM